MLEFLIVWCRKCRVGQAISGWSHWHIIFIFREILLHRSGCGIEIEHWKLLFQVLFLLNYIYLHLYSFFGFWDSACKVPPIGQLSWSGARCPRTFPSLTYPESESCRIIRKKKKIEEEEETEAERVPGPDIIYRRIILIMKFTWTK